VTWRIIRVTEIKKHSLGYELEMPDLEVVIMPDLCESIMFHPDGGLLLARKNVVVLIDPEEIEVGELLERYPRRE
jgi:hypothetical protein